MLIIKPVISTQAGEAYTFPETPIPQSAVSVIHDGTNYIIRELSDTDEEWLAVLQPQPAAPDPQP